MSLLAYAIRKAVSIAQQMILDLIRVLLSNNGLIILELSMRPQAVTFLPA